MKTLMLLATCVATLAVLSGCAPAPLNKADVDGKIVCDSERMDQVERQAHRNMADVHWVHCPQATLRVVSS